MPCVGFEPTIPASEQAKTVYGLGCSATVAGIPTLYFLQIYAQFSHVISSCQVLRLIFCMHFSLLHLGYKLCQLNAHYNI
jgi:hypothetical protein